MTTVKQSKIQRLASIKAMIASSEKAIERRQARRDKQAALIATVRDEATRLISVHGTDTDSAIVTAMLRPSESKYKACPKCDIVPLDADKDFDNCQYCKASLFKPLVQLDPTPKPATECAVTVPLATHTTSFVQSSVQTKLTQAASAMLARLGTGTASAQGAVNKRRYPELQLDRELRRNEEYLQLGKLERSKATPIVRIAHVMTITTTYAKRNVVSTKAVRLADSSAVTVRQSTKGTGSTRYSKKIAIAAPVISPARLVAFGRGLPVITVKAVLDTGTNRPMSQTCPVSVNTVLSPMTRSELAASANDRLSLHDKGVYPSIGTEKEWSRQGTRTTKNPDGSYTPESPCPFPALEFKPTPRVFQHTGYIVIRNDGNAPLHY